MADPRVLVALARAHRDRTARLADGTAETVGRLWDRYRPIGDDDLAAWQRATLPIVIGAQRAAARGAVGYLTAYSRLAGVPTPPPDIDLDELIAGLRNGTPADEVYSRPTITARRALSEGHDLSDALRTGRLRLVPTAHTDVMLADRAAASETIQQFPHVVGYRRMVNPGACRFCLLAGTQRYHVRDLAPLHANCKCNGTVPIIGTEDPGHILDKDLHKRLKDAGVVEEETLRRQIKAAKAAGDTTRETALRAQRDQVRARIDRDPALRYRREVKVREHGELGPTLTDATQHFTQL